MNSNTDINLIRDFVDGLFTDYTDMSFTQVRKTARRVIMPPNPTERSITAVIHQARALQTALEAVIDALLYEFN